MEASGGLSPAPDRVSIDPYGEEHEDHVEDHLTRDVPAPWVASTSTVKPVMRSASAETYTALAIKRTALAVLAGAGWPGRRDTQAAVAQWAVLGVAHRRRRSRGGW